MNVFPVYSPKKLTAIVPFNMTTSLRGSDKQNGLYDKVLNEFAEEEELKNFKATPIKCRLDKLPSTLNVKSNKEVTKPIELKFASNERQTKRAQFDEILKEKELIKQ